MHLSYTRLSRKPSSFKSLTGLTVGEFNVPTLIIHGDEDQMVPMNNSALLSEKLIKNISRWGSWPLRDS